jgi:hypothetical protein
MSTPSIKSPDTGLIADDGQWPSDRTCRFGDGDWWQAEIDAATVPGDPALCNLRITLLHHELSLALRSVTGAESGANFHTWAVWGSKKAGRTIRQEDVPWLRPAAAAAGGLAGGRATAALAASQRSRRTSSIAAALGAALALRRIAGRTLDRATERILGGNVTVLDDIGRATARFVTTVREQGDERGLDAFLASLRPGPTRAGSQDLLRRAYRHYFDASRADDPDRRDEHMLLANLLAILHEHWRLEPYIDASIPRPLREIVTARLLRFTAGAEALSVSRDVPARALAAFPRTLLTIESAELDRFLDGWDRTPDSATGSAASDWTEIGDRMNFIVDLFRSRHGDATLFAPPYGTHQRDAVLAGAIPAGPL